MELKPYRKREAVLHPEQAALLVIDLQNYFRRIARPILKNVLKVIEACRKKEVPVIYTQHGHTDPSSDGGVLGEWWGDLILVGTEDWRLLPEIVVGEKDVVLPKKRYSAFFETDLDQRLRSKGIKEVIISGVMTNLCCETTARDAFMRDYHVFILIDGTATRKGDLHLATLKNLGFGFAYLLTCEELIKALS
ncbi:MAG: isochorismatase family protein [Desulfobacterota bacterium]|nr:isochorismatase family protein [Thermodesulfobacteriota bacterium]